MDLMVQSGEYVKIGGLLKIRKFAKADVAASQTDSSVIAAVSGKQILILSAAWVTGSTATTLVFNSKGSGAGTAISCTYSNDAYGGAVLPFSPLGWFQTNSGEALTVTTGAGASIGIEIVYVEV